MAVEERPRADREPDGLREDVRAGLATLGVRRLLLAIHEASFPGAPAAGDDLGIGSPLSQGGRAFLDLIARLGFDGVQLGPRGELSPGNQSPYDATLFARNTLTLAPGPLLEDGLLEPDELAGLARAPGERVDHATARAAAARLVELAHPRALARPELAARREACARTHAEWMERDALFVALAAEHGTGDWRRWTADGGAPHPDQALLDPRTDPALLAARRARLLGRQQDAVARWVTGQWLAHAQHTRLRAHARGLGLRLFGDLQAGASLRDEWCWQGAWLRGYAMGAPPSRTNPAGQDWNYPVLDPAQSPGAAERLLATRLAKLLDEFDGLRIDHPHSLVCPWVYRTGQPDPLVAVRAGARLRGAPDLPDHPALAAFAIPRPAQLDRTCERWADGWVRALEPAQVDRYAQAFDLLVATARARGLPAEDVACEVLSTMPYPLQCVLERHGLGRFRVTHKADPLDPHDVYRTERASPRDWVMVGTHDTPPLWALLERWSEAQRRDRAAYLAARLAPTPGERAGLAARFAAPGALAQAHLADLLLGPARHALVFFADLLGERRVYNRPGTIDPENWSLRVTPDFQRLYRERLRAGQALDLPGAVALALRARGGPADLIARLEARARAFSADGDGPPELQVGLPSSP